MVKQATDRFLREAEVRRITGLSRSTRWRLERDGKFPRRRKITDYAVGWVESEVCDWMASKASGTEAAA